MSLPILSVQPSTILKELERVWADLGKQADPSAPNQAVLRACAMTFVVAVRDGQDQDSVNDTIAQLAHEHPSRTIVLRLREGAEEALEASVEAHCHLAFGGRQQICTEQIVIRATNKGLDEVYNTLLGLLVPDLPVVMWVRDAAILSWPEFQAVVPLADKLIFESRGMEAGAALDLVKRYRSPDRQFSDLAWTRLTPWREDIARLFDDPARRGALAQITSIAICHAVERRSLKAIYLAAWFRYTLRRDVPVEFLPTPGESPAAIHAVRIDTPDTCFSITADSAACMVMAVGAQSSSTYYREAEEAEVLGEELRILGRDQVYQQVVRLAEPLL